MVASKQQLVPPRRRIGTAGGNTRKKITIHETANTSRGAGAQAHANLQSNGNSRSASWHWQVDDKIAILSYPHTHRCWHSGNAEGNNTSIGVEICVNSDADPEKTLENAVALVKDLMAQENLTTADVVQHHHWSGKNCPTNLRKGSDGIFGVSWSDFIKMLGGAEVASKPTQSPSKTSSSTSKSVSQMATEVIAGQHGSGHANRQKSLGVTNATYAQVRAEVNRRSGVSTPTSTPSTSKSVSQMATEVINGQHGSGHANRQKSLGISDSVYAQVRAEVNRRAGVSVSVGGSSKSVSQMATEVINGQHGNGHAQRQKSLGISNSDYAKVRAEVNRRF